MEPNAIGDNFNEEVEMFDSSSYSDNDDSSSSSSDDDVDSMDLAEAISDMEDLSSNQRASYKILSLVEIRQCRENEIVCVSNALSISRTEATILLIHYDWDIETVTGKWASHMKEVREELGLFSNPVGGHESAINRICGICSATISGNLVSNAFCRHVFCKACWQDCIRTSLRESSVSSYGYIRTSLKKSCLILRCPDQLCDAAVDQDMISMVASESMYTDILLKTYLGHFCKGRWCPNFGCDHGVLLEGGNLISKFTCKCFSTYCYKCLKEAHQPLSCAAADNWRLEYHQESENWKILKLQNCPICYQTLELGSWNMRVECPVCNFDFCRMCDGSYLEYGHKRGDQHVHICSETNLTRAANRNENRVKAANALNRYHEYFAQWDNIRMERDLLVVNLQMMQCQELKVLAEKQAMPLAEVSFVTDAFLKVIECKRVFQCAIVYDYHNEVSDENAKALFNNLIRHGAFVLEQLLNCIGELGKFLNNAPRRQFEDCHDRLCIRTSVAHNYFENMEIAIPNGFTDINALRHSICVRESIERKPPTNVETSNRMNRTAGEISSQRCPFCSFPRDESTGICVMCFH